MIGGGWALILQENLATEPWVTTIDIGWIVKDEIPAAEHRNKQREPLTNIKHASHILYYFPKKNLRCSLCNMLSLHAAF